MVNHPNRSKKNPTDARSPAPAEIIAAREQHGLTQTRAAELIYGTLRAWQNWEAGERPMHPALWDLWRDRAAIAHPQIPTDWFGEKTRQVVPDLVSAFGIVLQSRYARAKELSEMLEFAELAARAGCAKYVKRVFYDSKACLCTFEFAPEVTAGDPIAARLRACADAAVGQFDWFGAVYGKNTV